MTNFQRFTFIILALSLLIVASATTVATSAQGPFGTIGMMGVFSSGMIASFGIYAYRK